MESLLHAYVTKVRRNELRVIDTEKMACAGGPNGRWLSAEGVDVVWVHPTATGVDRDAILGHELGHMVNGDQPDPLTVDQLFSIITSGFKHVSPELMKASLARSHYGNAEEAAAEEFSGWVTTWLADNPENQVQPDPLVRNLRASLDTRSQYW